MTFFYAKNSQSLLCVCTFTAPRVKTLVSAKRHSSGSKEDSAEEALAVIKAMKEENQEAAHFAKSARPLPLPGSKVSSSPQSLLIFMYFDMFMHKMCHRYIYSMHRSCHATEYGFNKTLFRYFAMMEMSIKG